MLGRTLLQPAPPITFGLKAAGWFAGVTQSWSPRRAGVARGACVQLGGAVGHAGGARRSRPGGGRRALARELGLRGAERRGTPRAIGSPR